MNDLLTQLASVRMRSATCKWVKVGGDGVVKRLSGVDR